MDPTVAAVLSSWSIDWGLSAALCALGLLYLRGFGRVRRQMPERFGPGRAASFLLGLLLLWVTLCSPLDAFGGLLLWVHMAQHLMLMFVVAPLLVRGAPFAPVLRGLPRVVFKDALGPFLGAPALQRLAHLVTHPVFAFVAFVASTWVWHAPPLYEAALRDETIHRLEHACFLLTGVLFWWPVVEPWPTRPRYRRVLVIPYLALAAAQNSAFSALFTFSDRVIYDSYARVPRVGGLDALSDQALAGVVMWIPSMPILVVPMVVFVVRLLDPSPPSASARARGRRLPVLQHAPVRPGIWARLRFAAVNRPGVRRGAQVLSLGVAALVVADGLSGTQVTALNLAGVVPWTYVRGLSVVALLLVGNLFCMACPMMLVRDGVRRVVRPRRPWPKALRNKWMAAALLLAYLWGYEAFALWDAPALTAYVLLGYFVAAVVVDGLFADASFCKYVCPIGQFQTLSAQASPLTIGPVDADVCARCETRECVRGSDRSPGCELKLVVPRKASNVDCTLCMECARACPHDNVTLLVRNPRAELRAPDRARLLGPAAQRRDLAVLCLVFAFGAYVNAALMVGPVVSAIEGGPADGPVGIGLLVVAGALLLPLLLVGGCAALAHALDPQAGDRAARLVWVSMSLLPLGFAMWLSHFGFHLATAWESFGAAVGAAFGGLLATADVGGAAGGADATRAMAAMMPGMVHGAAGPDLSGLRSLELLCLDAGLLATLYLLWRGDGGARRSARLPPMLLSVALWAVGVWILLQPMQMRGMAM